MHIKFVYGVSSMCMHAAYNIKGRFVAHIH